MQRKVLFFSGSFQYGVADNFIQGLIQALNAYHYDVIKIDLSNKAELKQQLSAVMEYEIAFTFSLNALGNDLLPYLAKVRAAPFYTLLLDHPLHSLQRFFGTHMTLLCVDLQHVRFALALSMQAHFFPHAVTVDDLEPRANASARQGILFPASYFDPNHHWPAIQQYFPLAAGLMQQNSIDNITELLLELDFMQTNKAPRIALDKHSITLLVYCDLYLRGRKRNQLITQCAEAGISLNIIGNGWIPERQIAVHQYLPAENFTVLQQRIANSRYVLHQAPGFTHALHERLLYPLLHNTPVLTQDNTFLQQYFSNNNSICFYRDVNHLKAILDSANEVYDEQGRQLALQKEQWLHRLQHLLL
ncbi:hypothetical protein J2X32_001925 [Rheinheimera pacifica]|uniref:glycosyltransferase family protein n=1 Tax=Rheinheimera pacifica TaxID=173990 RepID=UPI002861A446|nr:hypothetical protein [Rheinheimera pacifica]MDR6983291.1 hypothetical protein [Rheinheimera pacifica]